MDRDDLLCALEQRELADSFRWPLAGTARAVAGRCWTTRSPTGPVSARSPDPMTVRASGRSWPPSQADAQAAHDGSAATRHAELVETSAFDDLPPGLPIGDGYALLVRRFDGSDEGPIPIEDAGQALDRPPGDGQYACSYEELGAVGRQLCPEDVRAYLRQIALAIASGNGDAHLRNWSFHDVDRRTPRLAPAYDLVSTLVYPDLDANLALRLGGRTRAFDDLDAETLVSMAAAVEMAQDDQLTTVTDHPDRAITAWHGGIDGASELRSANRERLDARVERVARRLALLRR